MDDFLQWIRSTATIITKFEMKGNFSVKKPANVSRLFFKLSMTKLKFIYQWFSAMFLDS